MHRISEPRMDYTAKKSLEIFSELCGERNFANVRIVTTDWDGVDEYEGEAREKALSKRYFKHLIDGGAKMFRHDGALDSAQSIVSGLIEQPPVTLKMQEELDTGRALGNTSAGAVIMREMKEMQKEHEMRMQTLKDEMEQESKDVRDQLEAERQELVKRMAQIQEDSNRLEETRMARESHTPDLGNTSSESVNATIPGPSSLRRRDRHPQGRETPSNTRFRWELLPLVPASVLGLTLTKRYVKISGVLLSLLGVMFFLTRRELYGMYRPWLYGGGITRPLVSDRPSGGVWPEIPDAASGPVGDTSTEGQSEHPYGSSGTTRITVSTHIGNIFSGGISRTAFALEEEGKPWSWWSDRITRAPVSHRPSRGVLPDSRRGVSRERGMPRTEIKQSALEGPYGSIIDGRRNGVIMVSKPIGDLSDESPHTAVFVEDDEEEVREDKLPGFRFFYPIY